ncbi:MAG: ATP-binding protein [archaeon]
MKFINRKQEIKIIQECKELSKNKLYSLCIYGLRRIGKTRLILENLDENDLYFFVNKDKSSLSLLSEYELILRNKKIITEYEKIAEWEQLIQILIARHTGFIVFDEFQNFENVEPSIFGIIQKEFDLNENKKELLWLFSGSSIGLIKKLFFDRSEPLYGRIKRKMQLKELNIHGVIEMCNKLEISSFSEILKLYFIFGGFPKYYVSIEDEKLNSTKEIIDKFFLSTNAVLEEEVMGILAMEFGKRSGTYYNILGSLAQGNSKLSDLASSLSTKQTSLTRQIRELIDYFELIEIEKQCIGNKSLMKFKHPLVYFWFYFFFRQISDYKIRKKEFIYHFWLNLNNFYSKRFESFCLDLSKWLFPEYKIARQWGKFKGEKGKNTYELDVVGINEEKKEILFGEVKWQDNVDPTPILGSIRKKANHVLWNNDKRSEKYIIFAKSFKNKIESKDVLQFDLNDIEKKLLK